jgi:glycosyltransferase involved in cell wall biosynthesis
VKISIITVSYNAQDTIEETIISVINQNFIELEYIVIDGASTDNTVKIIKKYLDKIFYFVSEPDKGMYDAINKGIEISTGEVIGILNSDDIFSNNNIVSQIENAFLNKNIDAIFADISFVKNNFIIRKLSSYKWNPRYFEFGIMPAHPTFYCKRNLFKQYGNYKIDFAIAADFELMLRFIYINRIRFLYLPLNMVNMKLGGKSTRGFKSLYVINKEIYKSFILNGVKTNYLKIYLKYFLKIFEFKFFSKKIS